MPFLNKPWFALLVAGVLALVVSSRHQSPMFSEMSWLYAGLEMTILTMVGFLTFRFIVSTVLTLTKQT